GGWAGGLGGGGGDVVGMDGAMSADVTASIANDAAELPAGSAVIVDDFQVAAAAVSRDMADLVERWPAETAQLVLAGRSDPPLRAAPTRRGRRRGGPRGRVLSLFPS